MKTIQFEDKNFRISSKGWKDMGEYFQNKKGDVWEIKDGEYKGEQLFTWNAAIRETKKAGKKLPTKNDFVETFGNIPTWPKTGYRNRNNGLLVNQDSYGCYWSSSVVSTNAYYLYFNSSSVSPSSYDYHAHGFSVRCLKDNKKTIAEAKIFSPDIVYIRCHAILFKDKHGQLIYTFNSKKKADEFYKELTKNIK